jgi:hypothetical protein
LAIALERERIIPCGDIVEAFRIGCAVEDVVVGRIEEAKPLSRCLIRQCRNRSPLWCACARSPNGNDNRCTWKKGTAYDWKAGERIGIVGNIGDATSSADSGYAILVTGSRKQAAEATTCCIIAIS